jgi:hypothetical protein
MSDTQAAVISSDTHVRKYMVGTQTMVDALVSNASTIVGRLIESNPPSRVNMNVPRAIAITTGHL